MLLLLLLLLLLSVIAGSLTLLLTSISRRYLRRCERFVSTGKIYLYLSQKGQNERKEKKRDRERERETKNNLHKSTKKRGGMDTPLQGQSILSHSRGQSRLSHRREDRRTVYTDERVEKTAIQKRGTEEKRVHEKGQRKQLQKWGQRRYLNKTRGQRMQKHAKARIDDADTHRRRAEDTSAQRNKARECRMPTYTEPRTEDTKTHRRGQFGHESAPLTFSLSKLEHQPMVLWNSHSGEFCDQLVRNVSTWQRQSDASSCFCFATSIYQSIFCSTVYHTIYLPPFSSLFLLLCKKLSPHYTNFQTRGPTIRLLSCCRPYQNWFVLAPTNTDTLHCLPTTTIHMAVRSYLKTAKLWVHRCSFRFLLSVSLSPRSVCHSSWPQPWMEKETEGPRVSAQTKRRIYRKRANQVWWGKPSDTSTLKTKSTQSGDGRETRELSVPTKGHERPREMNVLWKWK